jgi:hypothetical protein
MSTRSAHVADFDSASAMLQATARFLCGRGFPALGMPRRLEPLAIAANLLPRSLRRLIYIEGGRKEAIPTSRLSEVREDALAEWATRLYPQRGYPAIAIGSSNGAVVHLCAALGIPWLPQTVLIPVRQEAAGPDEPGKAMEFGWRHAGALLKANPGLQLHHMHDPNQDRLMLQRMTYFRVKRLRLGTAYEQFVRRTLAPGGTIVLVDCRLRWPATRVGDRHFFQFGGHGGATLSDYFEGSARTKEFLERQGSAVDRWDPPEPDDEVPEAEWGFERTLGEDVERLARQHGYRVLWLTFDAPEDLAAPVADIYRRWYADTGASAQRLLAESFILLDPWLSVRTRTVPFWTPFSVERSVRSLERYLESADPYDEVLASLFAHGVESIGIARPEHWQRAMRRARKQSGFLGTRPGAFPEDFAVFARFYKEFKAMPVRCAAPASLALAEAERLIADLRTQQYLRAPG